MKKFLSIALAGVMALSATFSSCEISANANDWNEGLNIYDNMSGCISFDVPKKELEDSKIKVTIEKESTKPSIVWGTIKTLGKIVFVGLACIASCGMYRIYNQHIEGKKFTEVDNAGFWGKVDAKGAEFTNSFNSYVDKVVSPNLFGKNGVINRGINKSKNVLEIIKKSSIIKN